MNCLKTVLYSTTGACVLSVGLLCAQKAASPATPATYAASTEWPTYGHDPGGMRFSPQVLPAQQTRPVGHVGLSLAKQRKAMLASLLKP